MAQANVNTPITLQGLNSSFETAKLGLHEVIMDSAKAIRDYVPSLYKKATFKQYSMKKKVYSGLAPAEAWTATVGEIPKTSLQFLWDVDATHAFYAQATEYTLESKTFDEYGILSKLSTELGKAMAEKKQTLGAAFFNDAFDTAWEDGQFFFDSDHPYNTSYSSGTQSNVVSGALSVSTLHEAIYKLINVRDSRGRPLNLMPKRLYVYPTYAMIAKQILGVDMGLEYGTANNNRNPFKDWNIEVVPYPWFTTTTFWMLQGTETETYYSEPVGLTTNVRESDSHSTVMEAWFNCTFWAEQWQGWVGSPGS